VEAIKAKKATKRELIVVATMISRLIGTPVFSDRTEFSVTTRCWRTMCERANGNSVVQPRPELSDRKNGSLMLENSERVRDFSDVELVHVPIVSEKDDLLRSDGVPAIGRNRQSDGRGNVKASHDRQVGVLPLASRPNPQSMDIVVDWIEIHDLLRAASFPFITDHGRAASYRAGGELGQIGVRPIATSVDVEFMRAPVGGGVDHLLGATDLPTIGGEGRADRGSAGSF